MARRDTLVVVTSEIHVREVVGTTDLEAVRRLVLAHAADRATTPGVEHMRADAARLPGPYVSPRGGIWVAETGGSVVGCVALRPLADGAGEVKRMYVDAAWRGAGVGRALLERVIASARERGYGQLRLGTLRDMIAAQALYRSLGFVEIERYRADELMDTCFFQLELSS
jgi:ribosomal protein S18 acetylase RimI-like enzyme